LYTFDVGTLYIVATPIGNLSDMTLRAIEVLKMVSLIACEDTRRTLQLLNHLGIKSRLVSVRSHNEASSAPKIIDALGKGLDVAYASDAGTPGVSDPGAVLVRMAREAGFSVVPVPGVSAFAALVSVAGGMDKTVVFEGFLSPKPGRRRARLRELLETEAAFVLYESPFRALKLAEDLADLDSERYVCVGREMTKLHEEFIVGSAGEIRAELAARDKQLGEFAVYVSGKKSGKLLQ